MIHRAPFGSMERFVAVLLEHTGGKFPLWLSPQQVVVLPISEKFNDYAQKVSEFLNRSDVRTEVDDRNEKIGRKIRDNELKRIPYLLIVGEKEEAEGLVSVRAQGEGDKGQMSLEAFRDFIAGLVKRRSRPTSSKRNKQGITGAFRQSPSEGEDSGEGKIYKRGAAARITTLGSPKAKNKI